jgi:hypothetical protein
VAELARAIVGLPSVVVVAKPLLLRALEVYEVSRQFAESNLPELCSSEAQQLNLQRDMVCAMSGSAHL